MDLLEPLKTAGASLRKNHHYVGNPALRTALGVDIKVVLEFSL
jgi:hypothetical protein